MKTRFALGLTLLVTLLGLAGRAWAAADGVSGAANRGGGPPPSLFIEDLTWPELQGALNAGMVQAMLYAGSTEQNGPHMILGKHNRTARYVAEHLAQRLGNTLIYPIVPFAPTGDARLRTGHMRFPGSVSLAESTFSAVMNDLALSAHAAGFKVIFLMGDHGGGQQSLERLAMSLDRQWRAERVRVFYVGDLYFRSAAQVSALLSAEHLPQGEHAGIEDTAAMMFIDAGAVRTDQLAQASQRTGVRGDPRAATPALGERLVAIKINAAFEQMRGQLETLTRAQH